jgi:hypothetical protein
VIIGKACLAYRIGWRHLSAVLKNVRKIGRLQWQQEKRATTVAAALFIYILSLSLGNGRQHGDGFF